MDERHDPTSPWRECFGVSLEESRPLGTQGRGRQPGSGWWRLAHQVRADGGQGWGGSRRVGGEASF